MSRLVALVFLFAFGAFHGCASHSPAGPSRDYHFSPNGDDAGGDGSAARPFRSLAKANGIRFNPGDRALFEGGAAFAGNLVLDQDDAGTPDRPVYVGSFGHGRARIDAGEGTAVRIQNAGGIVVDNLLLAGTGPDRNVGSGLVLSNGRAGRARRLAFVRVRNVTAFGFGLEGIHVDAPHGVGFEDVRIEGCEAYANAHCGIYVSGQRRDGRAYPHANVYVGRCVARDNPGDPHAPDENRSGSGIFIAGVDGGTIEHSAASGNGRLCGAKKGGPMGIWASDSTRVAIQMCRSTGNRTGGKHDGGGFGLDGGVTHSVMQYNYSRDNDGSGFGLFEYAGARPWHDNTLRYNVSIDDGRRGGHAGIHVWNGGSGVRRAWVYHNTVIVRRARTGGEAPRALWVQSGTVDLRVMNNVFAADPGLRVIDAAAGQGGAIFAGNCYWAGGGDLNIRWAGASYPLLDGWRAGTGQERGTGIHADPGAPSDDGKAGWDVPGRTSPLTDAGVGLPFGTGGRDFAGTKVPQGRTADVGAWEALPP